VPWEFFEFTETFERAERKGSRGMRTCVFFSMKLAVPFACSPDEASWLGPADVLRELRDIGLDEVAIGLCLSAIGEYPRRDEENLL